MARKLWLTYAWKDNKDRDVDFVIQELTRQGLEVRTDRTQLIPGKRLWPQIGDNISSPDKADAWAILLSRSSLDSEPCQEEIAIALDRALRTRGDQFPLIGILLERIDTALLPPAIRTRLYVNIQDPNWAALVSDGVHAREPGSRLDEVPPVVHRDFQISGVDWIEARPRAGRWYPVLVMVPASEKDCITAITVGPPGVNPAGGMVVMAQGVTEDGTTAWWKLLNEVSPHQSLYICLKAKPSSLKIGSPGSLGVELRRLDE